MKKLFLIALAISAFAWLGCGDTMTDQMGTNAANGAVIDLVGGSYSENFDRYADGYKFYPLGDDDPIYIIGGRATTATYNKYGDLEPNGYTTVDRIMFGTPNPNYKQLDPSVVLWNIGNSYEIVARFASTTDKITMAIGSVADTTTKLGAVIAVLNENLGAIGGNSHSIMLMIGTTLNITGYLPIAHAAIPDFAVDTDYTFRLDILDDGTNATGASFQISVNDTVVIAYDGETGEFTPTTAALSDAQQDGILTINDGDTANGLPAATWLLHWTGFVWGNATTIQNTLLPLATRRGATSENFGFTLKMQPGVVDKGPSVDRISINAD